MFARILAAMGHGVAPERVLLFFVGSMFVHFRAPLAPGSFGPKPEPRPGSALGRSLSPTPLSF